jgi:cell wall-associated NlpC family hydrolase
VTVNVAEPAIRTPTASQFRKVICITGLALLAGACATTRHAPAQGSVAPLPVAPATAPAAEPSRPAAPERFVAAAMAMLGQPYRYGGAAPGGFDCSGLVVYAARDAGLALPRTTQDLLATGEPVALADLRAGDLVFLHLAAKDLHVGIALDQHRFVHAPSSGGSVRIDALDARPYAQAFLGARRLRFPTP